MLEISVVTTFWTATFPNYKMYLCQVPTSILTYPYFCITLETDSTVDYDSHPTKAVETLNFSINVLQKGAANTITLGKEIVHAFSDVQMDSDSLRCKFLGWSMPMVETNTISELPVHHLMLNFTNQQYADK